MDGQYMQECPFCRRRYARELHHICQNRNKEDGSISEWLDGVSERNIDGTIRCFYPAREPTISELLGIGFAMVDDGFED